MQIFSSLVLFAQLSTCVNSVHFCMTFHKVVNECPFSSAFRKHLRVTVPSTYILFKVTGPSKRNVATHSKLGFNHRGNNRNVYKVY